MVVFLSSIGFVAKKKVSLPGNSYSAVVVCSCRRKDVLSESSPVLSLFTRSVERKIVDNIIQQIVVVKYFIVSSRSIVLSIADTGAFAAKCACQFLVLVFVLVACQMLVIPVFVLMVVLANARSEPKTKVERLNNFLMGFPFSSLLLLKKANRSRTKT